MRKNCLVVTYYFPPLGGGGVQRIVKFIKYLDQIDWNFSVITSTPESSFNIESDSTLMNEVPENTKIYRICKTGQSARQSSRQKLISKFKSNYLSRWLSAFFFIPDMYNKWAKKVREKILELMVNEKYDMILVSCPPYSLARIAADLRQQIDIPLVLDMRDPWSVNPYKIHPTKLHLLFDKKMEFNSIRQIQYGISVLSSLIEYYRENISHFNDKHWITITNGYDEEDFVNIKSQKTTENKLNIAFSGTLYSHLNNPEPLFKAIAALNESEKDKIVFHHIGKSNISLKHLAGKYGISKCVKEWKYRPHRECLEILSAMDILCFILDSSYKNARYTIGGKVYEYLRLRKPILALIPESGEASDLINLTKSGYVIEPNHTDKIVLKLSSWIQSPPMIQSQNIQLFDRKKGAKELDQFFNRIISV